MPVIFWSRTKLDLQFFIYRFCYLLLKCLTKSKENILSLAQQLVLLYNNFGRITRVFSVIFDVLFLSRYYGD